MRSSYSVIITCRNSEDTINAALLSHRRQTLKAEYIIVIDDGSSDKTSEILKEMQHQCDNLYVITLPDRGYDIKRVVRNWNEAIKFAHDMKLSRTDYHLIATDDTVYNDDYAEKIINFMDSHPNVAMVSGNYANSKPVTPHGAGRFVRNSFFDGCCWHGYYPWKMGYESAILFEAVRYGFTYMVLDDARFQHTRSLGKNHKFREYGASMKTLGYHPVFVFGRCVKCLLTGNLPGRIGALYMLYYYLTYRPQLYGYDSMHSPDITGFVRQEQVDRIKNIWKKKITLFNNEPQIRPKFKE
jgi:glycosyltransferase involved in cell wall biosynthesis